VKKWALALGVIAIFTGIIFIPSSIIQQQNQNVEKINDLTKTWAISGYFKQNENLTLDFSPHIDWSLPRYVEDDPDLTPHDVKYFMVNVTSNVSQAYTLFKVRLVTPGLTPAAPPYGFTLELYDIQMVHQGLLITGDSPQYLGGTVPEDGLYLVNCSLYPSMVIDMDPITMLQYTRKPSAPIELILYSVTEQTTYPYYFLLPIAVPTLVIGGTLSVWGSRGSRRRQQEQLKKKMH
jgi:hypothetical protein